MDALVHFTVGLTGGLLVLLVVDWPPRREFLATFTSGVWAMIPDGHWMFHELGVDAVATVWRAAHGTPAANLFWFHRVLDQSETGRPRVEMGVALLGLFVAVGVFYAVNDWDAD